VGDDVIINLALPTQNIDQSTPISLGRVDVYAYTGRGAPPAARGLHWLEPVSQRCSIAI